MSKNWESPLTITEEMCREVVEAYDSYIVEEVRKVVPHVDKEELVKALEYDRDQYEKGYADGRADATKHGHWTEIDRGLLWQCSECGHHSISGGHYCDWCGCKMDEVGDGRR